MFTVKHIACEGFDESLWETSSVRHGISPDTNKPTVFFDTEGGTTCSIDAGVVYVMNREGATVAKYDMLPHGAGAVQPSASRRIQRG